ncbi:MAG TPA: outer membrane beta-barrel protein [Chitinophagaceae bacterium]|nr:outer membrane beta-barrel protein [Chitinophagaceae bacterium]
MKKIWLSALCSFPIICFAQFGLSFGAKGGINFANVTHASDIKASSRSGYMIGAYIAPKVKKVFGYRSEIVLSRQGYDYNTNTNTGNVDLDYLLLPQLFIIKITGFVQLHLGGQVAILLNAKMNSTNGSNAPPNLIDYFNRFDYGVCGGLEVFPLTKGLFIGARLNTGFKDVSNNANGQPDFIPGIDAKNNVLQLYAGWRF